jgi:uncharacterized protein YoxC
METVLIVLIIAFASFVAFSVPFLFQLWQNARNMALTLQILNKHLPTILNNFEEITTNINHVSHTINDQVENLDFAIQKIQNAMGLANDSDNSLKEEIVSPFLDTVKTLSWIIKGIGTFISVFRQSR